MSDRRSGNTFRTVGFAFCALALVFLVLLMAMISKTPGAFLLWVPSFAWWAVLLVRGIRGEIRERRWQRVQTMMLPGHCYCGSCFAAQSVVELSRDVAGEFLQPACGHVLTGPQPMVPDVAPSVASVFSGIAICILPDDAPAPPLTSSDPAL